MMQTWMAAALGLALAPVWASGQKLELKLDAIAARASEKAEVDLDGDALATARKMGGKLPVELDGVTEVHVRTYEFKEKGAYTESDLENIRKQVGAGSGWSRVVSVKEKDESVEVYLFRGSGGLLVLAAEAKELAVVHLVGDLKTAKLQEIVQSKVWFELEKVAAAGR